MKRTTNLLFAILLWLVSSTPVMTQTVNTNRFISINVVKGQQIKLDFAADQAATPVKIVSGSGEYNPTVGTSWSGMQNYLADDSVMTVYGDITKFDCSGNYNNVTGIDLSHNTIITWFSCGKNSLQDLIVSSNKALKELYCYNNSIKTLNLDSTTELTKLSCARNSISSLDLSHNKKLKWLNCSDNRLTGLDVSSNILLEKIICHKNNSLSTQALDLLYCSLPDRTGTFSGYIEPIYDDSSPNDSVVLATNSQNALDKNWKVKYAFDETDIPATTGSYACTTLHDSVNMDRYITLTVADGVGVYLDFRAAADNTHIRIVSGSNIQNITIGTNWLSLASYIADGTEMKIYGDLTVLDCGNNGANIQALDVTKNTALTELYCHRNQLTALDVTKNTALTKLYCYENQLTALDVTKNTDLVMLYCNENQLTALDVSKNTALTVLGCYNNQITALDITKDTVLTTLYCNENQLTTLDVTKNIALTKLYCYKNQLTALDVTKNIALTELYCYENRFTTLDVTKNTALEVLGCYNNQIKALDVTKNTALTKLYCYNNPQLNSLNIVGNNAIKNIYIYGCNFSACGLDSIFRDLPQCLPTDSAKILIKSNASTNPGTDGCRDTIASHRNWAVLNFKGNNSMDTIKNSFYTCVPNMNLNRAIRLGVVSGQTISVAIKAAANNTHIRFTCGSTDTILTVDTSWSYWQLPAKADSMVFFGDITRFNCNTNGNNITAISTKTNPILEELQCIGNAISTLDLSHNVELSKLYCLGNRLTSLDLSHNHKLTKLACYDNPQLQHIDVNGCYPLSRVVVYGCNLSDCGLDSLLRALPRRSSDNKGKIFIKDGTSTNPGSSGCQDTIASHKNWVVLDYNGGSPDTIANTHYTCANTLNLNRAIRLGVVSGQTISVAIKAAANNTHIRFTCGSTDTILTVGTSWSYWQLPAKADSMVFFGDITRFNCNTNGNNITAISTKTNTILEELQCIGNAISTLDLSHNVELSELYCLGNRLTSLDLSHNHKLTKLACYDNPQLQHIDVNGCYPLSRVVVYGCNLSDCGLDSLLRALPRRSSDNKGKIFIKDGTSTNPGSGGCQDTIASHKNWVVLDYNGGSPDTIANTHYTCADTPTGNDRHLTNETDIKIYPNPVADILYLSATASTIQIYDIYGIEVARATDTDKVGVSHLPDGVYIVRADGTVAKMVKQ